MTGQSRSMSFVEVSSSVMAGWGVSFIANLIVLPAFGFDVTVADALGIGAVFTIISIARSYLFRRVFNYLYVRNGR